MKKLVSIILFFLSAQFICAQSNPVLRDSVERVLKNAKTDTATCFALLKRIVDLSPAEHETAVYASKWAVAAAKKNGNKECLTQAWYTLGRCYQIIGDYNTAIRYFKIAAKLAEKYKFYETQASLYDCFATIYGAVKQYKLSEQYYHKAIELSERKKLNFNLPAIYFNLASLYYEAKPDSNYTQNALKNLNIALNRADTAKNWDVIAYGLWLKSLIYEEKLHNDSSVVFVDRAFLIAKAHDMTDFYCPYYHQKGMMLVKKGKHNEAINIFEQGLKTAEQIHSHLWQYNFYQELAKVSAEKGEYEKALEYHIQHKMYYDSVVNTENFAKINDLETQLKIEKKEKEKKISDLLLQKSEQRQQNLWIIIISISVLVLGLVVFVVVLVRNVRARRQAYHKLQQKNIEIQQQGEQLAKLSGEITKYQSQMNPHFVFNALNSIQGFVVNNEKEKTLLQLGNFSKLMRTTLNNSNHELISLENEMDYLKTFIAFEQERFKNKIGFTIDLNVDGKETMVPPMMIQPLLENALKHARLGDVSDATIGLKIEEENKHLKITVTDNGKGIAGDKNEIIKQSHSMSIIQSRIELAYEREKMQMPLNYFSIASVPQLERGTRVVFYLPMLAEF
ncbi:MAG TPA: histidine kinase [Flavobacteriales bacterium]|nr:histidine kinase [Flavobacteriales bacterium]